MFVPIYNVIGMFRHAMLLYDTDLQMARQENKHFIKKKLPIPKKIRALFTIENGNVRIYDGS